MANPIAVSEKRIWERRRQRRATTAEPRFVETSAGSISETNLKVKPSGSRVDQTARNVAPR